jgi:glucosamine--fructose-6-phosphate aminotransferase (isomerizing)
MEREILSQPEVLRENVDHYLTEARRALWSRNLDMILLAARGSSDHAALFARYLFEIYLVIPVTLSAPSVITRYKATVNYKRALAIGISQSGAAPDVAEVLRKLRIEDHITLGITNTADSPLTRVSEYKLMLNAGDEVSVPATKTFTTTLLALYQCARALGASLPDPSPFLPDREWFRECQALAKEHAPHVIGLSPVFTLGRGFSFPTALETALKLMESALIVAKGYSAADFEHGPKALAGEGSLVIGFGGNYDALSEQNCLVLRCPEPRQEVPETLLPLWHIVYSQFLALEAARIKGIDPDEPQFIRKVTKTS